MSLDDERKEIQAAYIAAPVAGATFVKAGFPADLTKSDGVPIIVLSLQSGAAFQGSLGSPGSNLVRHAGVAFFRIYTAGGEGQKSGSDIAQSIEDIYLNNTFNNIKCMIPYSVPVEDEEPFSVTLVAVPYRREEFKA